MLEDIAILTGGQVITSDLGLELKDTTLDQLGRAHQVKVNKDNTTIVNVRHFIKEDEKIMEMKKRLIDDTESD